MAEWSLVGTLSSALVAIVAGAIGLRGAQWNQDRERAKRERNAAIALQEDLHLIRDALGSPGTACVTSLELGGEPEVPLIHRWVEGSISELASADPAIVSSFMRLETLLSHRTAELIVYLAIARAEDYPKRQIAACQRGLRQQSDQPGYAERYESEIAAHNATLPGLADAVAGATKRFCTGDVDLRAHIQELDHRLSALVRRRLPAFVSLRRRRRPDSALRRRGS